MAYMVI